MDVAATMLLAREVGRRMKEAGGGVVLNMGWDQAETGMEGDSGELFAATKGAVMAFTQEPGPDAWRRQVRVNCLAPGWIRTAWGEGASERGRSASAARRPCAAGARRRTWRRRPLAGVAGRGVPDGAGRSGSTAGPCDEKVLAEGNCEKVRRQWFVAPHSSYGLLTIA